MHWTPLVVSALTVAPVLAAQTTPPSEAQQQANWTAHRGDFNYLLGDWEFTSQSKQYGAGHGVWSAVRLEAGGPILDEYRVLGDSGQTYAVSTTFRSYNAATDRWELVSVDEGTGLRNIGTGQLVNGEMHIEQTFGATSPRPALWRIRYYDIRPNRFSWVADVSRDGGQTWTTEFLKIEARRIGPARPFPPLTHPTTTMH